MDTIKVKYTAKRRPDDGWGCYNIYAGKHLVASEHRLPYKTSTGSFVVRFSLPGLTTISNDSREELRDKTIEALDEWFSRLVE